MMLSMSGVASIDETTVPLAELYRLDFHAWCLRVAEMLANGKTGELDTGHLREEIESLAGRDEREVISRMKRILQHLLKLEYQPRKRTKSWEATLANQRGELAALLEQSPSLVGVAERGVGKAYKLARRLAAIETGLTADSFPSECPYTMAQIRDPEL
jgi:Domain of unknown function DUF29